MFTPVKVFLGIQSLQNTLKSSNPPLVILNVRLFTPHDMEIQGQVLTFCSWVLSILGLFEKNVKLTGHILIDGPKVKLTNIFKVPEVPKKAVVEEKPAIPVPEKVESPPQEGTHWAVICDSL